MLKWLICLLWGHKTVHKAYTGEKIRVRGVGGNEYDISLYKHHRTNYCTRCGKVMSRDSDQWVEKILDIH